MLHRKIRYEILEWERVGLTLSVVFTCAFIQTHSWSHTILSSIAALRSSFDLPQPASVVCIVASSTLARRFAFYLRVMYYTRAGVIVIDVSLRTNFVRVSDES